MPPVRLSAATAPRPPLELANRVGSLKGQANPWTQYDFVGEQTRREIQARLPDSWTFDGRHVLDFGCGAGRTLRHFLSEAELGEFWGCDIDAASIDWMQKALCPPLHVARNGPAPPLPFEDGTFDLVWAVSVFTHLADTWSAWLVEMHRILAPEGILIATFMGPALTELITGEQWRDDHFGMTVTRYGQSWEQGGPMVLHSPWWLEAHWGRGFEILRLDAAGFAAQGEYRGHGVVVMRRRNIDVSIADLEEVEPNERREALALAHSVRQHWQEIAGLQELLDSCGTPGRLDELEGQVRELTSQLEVVATSKSWRLTRPLRTGAMHLRSVLRKG